MIPIICLPAYLPTCLPAYLPTCLPACGRRVTHSLNQRGNVATTERVIYRVLRRRRIDDKMRGTKLNDYSHITFSPLFTSFLSALTHHHSIFAIRLVPKHKPQAIVNVRHHLRTRTQSYFFAILSFTLFETLEFLQHYGYP
jgi:hypothetical protein